MIPVYMKTGAAEEPSPTIYYLLARNGVFLVKKTALFSAATRVDTLVGFEPHQEALDLGVPRVPRRILEAAYGFFLEVYQRWEGEAIALLYYSPQARKFQIAIPPQSLYRYRTVRGWRTESRLTYGTFPRPEGFLKLGDIHSHADMPAFFSATDDRDDSEDGLRIVLGQIDRRPPDIAVSFVTGGARFYLQREEACEPFTEAAPPPPHWMEQVTCTDEKPAEERGAMHGQTYYHG